MPSGLNFALRSLVNPRNIPYWQTIRGHLSRNQTRINKDIISKNIWNIWCEAGSCVQSQNAGSEPVGRMERMNFLKSWIWQGYFVLIILNYRRNMAKLVQAGVLIFCDNLTNGFYPLFFRHSVVPYWPSNFPRTSTSTYWWANCGKTFHEPKSCSCAVRQMTIWHLLQYSYSPVQRFSNCVLLY